MKLTDSRYWSLIFITIVVAAACSSDEVPAGDTGIEPVPDAGVDASDTTIDDVSDAGNDLSPADVQAVAPIDFDPAMWRGERDCEPLVSVDSPDIEFTVPDRPDPPPPPTESSVYAQFGATPSFGGELPQRGGVTTADAALEPGNKIPHVLFAEVGQDVTIHFAFINNLPALELHRTALSMLVDYQPVEARYVRWGPKRKQVIDEKTTTGIMFPVTRIVEIVDVTIPGEVFSEKRNYELASLEHNGRLGFRPYSNYNRYALYVQSYNRKSPPCHEPPLDSPAVPVERELLQGAVGRKSLLFTREYNRLERVRAPIPVAGGTEMVFYASMVETARTIAAPQPVVWMAFVNGRPLGPRWNVSTATSNTQFAIDARKSFTWTVPEEPGEYNVFLGQWEDAYRVAEDPLTFERQVSEHEELIDKSSPFRSSNILRFIVTDEE